MKGVIKCIYFFLSNDALSIQSQIIPCLTALISLGSIPHMYTLLLIFLPCTGPADPYCITQSVFLLDLFSYDMEILVSPHVLFDSGKFS